MQVKKYLKILPKNQLLVNNDRKKLLRESTIFRSIFLCFCPAILSKLLLSWLSLEYILCGLTYFTADDKFGSIQNMFRFNLKVRLFVSRSFRQFPISSSICKVIPACKFKVSCQNLFPCGNHPSWFLVKVLSFGMLPAAKVEVYVTRNEGQQVLAYRMESEKKITRTKKTMNCILACAKTKESLQKLKILRWLQEMKFNESLNVVWKSCRIIAEEQRNLGIAFVHVPRPEKFSMKKFYLNYQKCRPTSTWMSMKKLP